MLASVILARSIGALRLPAFTSSSCIHCSLASGKATVGSTSPFLTESSKANAARGSSGLVLRQFHRVVAMADGKAQRLHLGGEEADRVGAPAGRLTRILKN